MPRHCFTGDEAGRAAVRAVLYWVRDQPLVPPLAEREHAVGPITYGPGIVLDPVQPRAAIKGRWLADAPRPRHPRRKRTLGRKESR